MRSDRVRLAPLRVSQTAGAGAVTGRIAGALKQRPLAAVAAACLVFLVLALIVAPLLSFILAAALGAGAYALLARRGAATLGRMRMADSPAYRRASSQAPLFLDLAAMTLFGIGLMLVAEANAMDNESLLALGLGAALVGAARAS